MSDKYVLKRNSITENKNKTPAKSTEIRGLVLELAQNCLPTGIPATKNEFKPINKVRRELATYKKENIEITYEPISVNKVDFQLTINKETGSGSIYFLAKINGKVKKFPVWVGTKQVCIICKEMQSPLNNSIIRDTFIYLANKDLRKAEKKKYQFVI